MTYGLVPVPGPGFGNPCSKPLIGFKVSFFFYQMYLSETHFSKMIPVLPSALSFEDVLVEFFSPGKLQSAVNVANVSVSDRGDDLRCNRVDTRFIKRRGRRGVQRRRRRRRRKRSSHVE